MKFKRLIAMLLCVMMLVSLMPAALADGADEASGEDVYIFPERTPVHFSEMTCDNFDEDAFVAALDDMEAAIFQEGMIDALKADWDILVEQYDRISTDYALSNILYMCDPTDEAFELYSGIEMQLIELSDRLLIVLREVLESSYGDALSVYINSEDIIADAIDYIAMTDEEFALSEERTAMEDEYYTIAASGARVAGSKAEKLYLRMLDNFIASTEFTEYDNFVDYVYDMSFFRDYGVEDIAVMKEWVKDFVVPYYFGIINELVDNEKLDGYYTTAHTQDEIIAAVGPWVSSVSEEAAETFNMMVEYGLINIEASDTKNDGGFTTSLQLYGVPFIFDCPYGYLGDIETLIHEFGHYYETMHNMKPMMYDYSNIDVAEINSQGMEMLMLSHAEEIYGKSYAEVASLYNLYNIFGAIIDGCMFDEFQQRALYGRMDGSITEGKQLTELYLDIEYEYFEDMYYSWAEDWWQVHHTFTSPFYYISYATSATAALGFLMMANEDYDAAVEKYVELIDIGSENGFLETLEMIGMPLPTTEEGCAELTEGLENYFENVLGIHPLLFR